MRAVRSQIQTESRMQKVIEKEKPTQAPRHPTTVQSFERLINGEKNYDVIMGQGGIHVAYAGDLRRGV